MAASSGLTQEFRIVRARFIQVFTVFEQFTQLRSARLLRELENTLLFFDVFPIGRKARDFAIPVKYEQIHVKKNVLNVIKTS